MTRGRHRQPSSRQARLPPVAVGALTVSGAVLVATTSDPVVLRTALAGAILAAVGLVVLMQWRERRHVRALADEARARHRERSLLQSELHALRDNLAALTTQVAQLRADAFGLREQIGSLQADKAEAEELVRRLRAARAYGPAQRYLPLTPAAFHAAAEALAALFGPGDEDTFGGLAGYLPAGRPGDHQVFAGEQDIDLTPHEDTIPIGLAAVRGA